jgi:hypothetical protein
MKITFKTYSFLFVAAFGLFFYGCDGKNPAETPKKAETRTAGAPKKVVRSGAPESKAGALDRAKKVQELIEKLDSNDEREAYDAVMQLALIGDEAALQVLMDVAERESGMMRAAAIKGLGNIGDKRALSLLLDAMGDDDKTVRHNAVSGLGNLRDESAVEPLIEMLQDEDDWIRMAAQSSLEKITRKKFTDYEAWSAWHQGR